ncbi:hypothetical protein jhhlp_001614 [Lomentospora prolificans]|uniref:C2H2-type domain-containing protein n=1 Tax=Lomentospora prolificans TaxID=41688 RepID=A0A2N3NIQ7_9PEZI|nr:hypothetical protein jhhlp_001614 [Lomentospora prolificans]
MSSAFRPVNSPLPNADAKINMTSPMTPRPAGASPADQSRYADDATTPTRASFKASLSTQKPLPTSPFPQAVQVPNSTSGGSSLNEREGSAQTNNEDVEMEGTSAGPSDPTMVGTEPSIQEEPGSDDDSVNADGSRSNKKKKSQRFYCTDYPPCNLSFTRSEHLARHIRKHTGERPFQCHCSRRFSRLDNLRQHAQTVHINEDIPMDSLAATGSRYQRQIRTDRVRPTGRARASTAGSVGGPVRGHSKSLSTSSITSMSSVGSVFGARDDLRRRPPPLVMADHRPRMSMDSYASTGDGSYTSYRHPSPGDFSTPTSATFSTNQSSPRWSAMASPTSSHSRSQSMYADHRGPVARRLSVPSGVSPFQSQPGPIPGRPMMVPAGMNHTSAGPYSPASHNLVTPPSSGWSSRRDSISTTASTSDEAWRRRTWHPDSRNFVPPTNTLNSVANSDSIQLNPPAPLANGPPNRASNIRLPGIESFDSVAHPVTPPRRPASPMIMEAEMTSPQHPDDDRRNPSQWDMGLHRGLTRLDISKNNTPPHDSAGSWAKETERAMQVQNEQVRTNPPTVRFQVEPPHNTGPPPRAVSRAYHQHTLSAPSITTPRESKRHGWYHGPMNSQSEAPEPHGEPRQPRVDRMVHPNIAAFSGFPAREPAHPPPPPNSQQSGPASPDSLRRLEALVAVATSEGKTAAAY